MLFELMNLCKKLYNKNYKWKFCKKYNKKGNLQTIKLK